MNVVTPRIIVVESHEIKKVACIAKREVSSWQELRQKLRAKQLLPETVRLSRGSKRWLGRISLIFKPLTSDTVFRRYVRQLTTMAPKMRNRVTINREIILSNLFCSKDLKKLQAANMTLKLPSDSIFSVFLDVLMWAQPILLLIRPLLEYGCIVWHFSLPLCLSDRLESIKKKPLGLSFLTTPMRQLYRHWIYQVFFCVVSPCALKVFPSSLVLPIHVSYPCSLPGAVMQMTLLLLCATLLILHSRQCVLSVSNVALSHLCFLANK